MNEKPESIWKRPWRGPAKVIAWLALLIAAVFLTICCIDLLVGGNTRMTDLIPSALAISICVAVPAVLLALFIRWLCCWRNFRRFLIGVACFATLIALAFVGENVRGKWAWEKFKRQWEAKGERFDRASVVPPPVPEDQNFALTPIVASSYAIYLDRDGNELRPRNTNVVARLEMSTTTYRPKPPPPTNGIGNWQKSTVSELKAWQQYYRSPAMTKNAFPVAPQPQSPAADVLLALSKYDSAIEELRQAGRLPHSRFPLSYNAENTAAILLPHLSALKRCSLVLQLRALAELQTGQDGQALADVKLVLRLAESMRAEPFLISHLIRIALLNLALQPVWEGLAQHKWSDAALIELDRELAGLDFLEDYELAMHGEMVFFQGGLFDFLRRRPEELANLGGMGEEAGSSAPAPRSIIFHLFPGGWLYQNQLRCARMMVKLYLPAVDLHRGIMLPTFIDDEGRVLETELRHHNPYNFLESLLLPALGNAAKKFASGQSSVVLARVACALERYHLAHRVYPESLDALAPQFIAKLPHDVIGGQPLKYRRTADGQFVLYSIGWNEKDDGGEVGIRKGRGGARDLTEGDWVWRYPAK